MEEPGKGEGAGERGQVGIEGVGGGGEGGGGVLTIPRLCYGQCTGTDLAFSRHHWTNSS